MKDVVKYQGKNSDKNKRKLRGRGNTSKALREMNTKRKNQKKEYQKKEFQGWEINENRHVLWCSINNEQWIPSTLRVAVYSKYFN